MCFLTHHFLECNNSQHGYVTGTSCVTNIIECLNYVGSVLDSGGQIDVVYLDTSKAFYKVNQNYWYESYGIRLGLEAIYINGSAPT